MGSLWASLAPFILASALMPIELVITLALLGTPGRVRPAGAAVEAELETLVERYETAFYRPLVSDCPAARAMRIATRHTTTRRLPPASASRRRPTSRPRSMP